MLLRDFLNEFEIVPFAPIITGITFVFTFHMRCISIVKSLYFRIFSDSFLITFLSPEIATSINIHVPFSLSRIIMSGLLLGIVLSVCNLLVPPICLLCLLDLFLLMFFYYYYYYYHWGDLGVHGWVILGWISRRWDVGIWTGLGWPRIETGGGRL